MKKAISYLKSRMTSWKLLVGTKERCSTSVSSATESCCEKSSKTILAKLAFLAEENRRLKEELRIRDLQENTKHDV